MRPATLVVVMATLVACGGGSAGQSRSDTRSDASSSASGQVTVADAWIRPTPPVSNVGAFYLTIRNDGGVADAVIGASAPRCDEIEIHQTATVDGVSSMGQAGPADLEVDAGGDLVFEPSGLHVMCLGLDQPVVAGELVGLTVELGRAGSVTVEAVAENR